ncbi:MAG: tetratricopeptide repeat protein [Chloroflexi bacterium]|nr:tetratricopeptide repeat protein [Chloroflexota bacterium]
MFNFVDVTEADFEEEVLAYSQHTPVVVLFWAPWCKPCLALRQLLEALIQETQGALRLARVNVDQSPNLALRFGVRGLPAVMAFSRGMVVNRFQGTPPEARVRDFIARLTPNPASLALEKGAAMLETQAWEEAEAVYREILTEQPDLPEARLGLAKSLLGQGKALEALWLLQDFPASREYPAAMRLKPLAEALVWASEQPDFAEEPLEAIYLRALRLIAQGNLPAAMDGLLEVLRADKHYRDGLPKDVMLGLFELLGDEHPLTRQYRQELASVLF